MTLSTIQVLQRGITHPDCSGVIPMYIVPHPRTLRKAREQVKAMVNDGVSCLKIRTYLRRFVLWWAKTVETWRYEILLHQFIQSCWDVQLAAIGASISQRQATLERTDSLVSAERLASA